MPVSLKKKKRASRASTNVCFLTLSGVSCLSSTTPEKKPPKDPSIAFSGTHLTRGNPKNGCGGLLFVVCARTHWSYLDLPSEWRMLKVGVAVVESLSWFASI